jgi:hypothetical protein
MPAPEISAVLTSDPGSLNEFERLPGIQHPRSKIFSREIVPFTPEIGEVANETSERRAGGTQREMSMKTCTHCQINLPHRSDRDKCCALYKYSRKRILEHTERRSRIKRLHSDTLYDAIGREWILLEEGE